MRALLTAISLLLVPAPDLSGDWPQWRGPGRDGSVDGFPALLPGKPVRLAEDWKVEVGEGHSSPVVAGGRIYLHVRQGEEEVVLCLALADGKEVWRSGYQAPYEVEPVAAAHGKGPKSTPAVKSGRVYSFGISGILSSFDAEKGGLLWRKEFGKEFPRTSPLYGTALSPLVEDGLCIVHAGGHGRGALRAFDARTGEVKWSSLDDGPGYSSPVAVDLAGEPGVVTQTQDHLVGVALRTGAVLFRRPFRTPYDQNAVTVLPYKDLLIVSGLEQGAAALRIARKEGKLAPEEAWKSGEFSMYMSSPVVEGNRLFGLSHKKKGQLFCLDADSGRTLWKAEGGLGENASLVNLRSAIMVLTTGGELLLLEPKAESFRILSRHQAAASPTWAHPAVAGGRLVIKDRTTLASLKLLPP